jgi:PRTRC genetic system protein E
MSLFAQLTAILGPDERLRFDLARNKDGQLTVLVQPYLAQPIEHLEGDAARLRAALAMPLRVSGTAAELDAGMPALLAEFADRRRTVGGQVAALDALKEAGKTGARLQAEKAATPAPSVPATQAATALPAQVSPPVTPAVPAAPAPVVNPGSLFD